MRLDPLRALPGVVAGALVSPDGLPRLMLRASSVQYTSGVTTRSAAISR